MRRMLRSLTLAVAALGFAAIPALAADRHALLVAVSRPAGMTELTELRGVHNDVQMARQLAIDWGVAPTRITQLESGSRFEPTYAAVRRAMQALLARLRAGDEVMLYLTGHGAQQPVLTSERARFEEDGLDEVLLLADTSPELGPLSVYRNALLDDEVGDWIQQASARGAFVWLIVDACHAGSFERSGSPQTSEFDVVAAKRAPLQSLGLMEPPRIRRDATLRRWHQPRRAPRTLLREPPSELAASGMQFAAFYAVSVVDDAVEVALKPGGERMGLFTLQLAQAFANLVSSGGTGFDYRALGQAVFARYRKLPAPVPPRGWPTPDLLAMDWSRTVLPPRQPALR